MRGPGSQNGHEHRMRSTRRDRKLELQAVQELVGWERARWGRGRWVGEYRGLKGGAALGALEGEGGGGEAQSSSGEEATALAESVPDSEVARVEDVRLFSAVLCLPAKLLQSCLTSRTVRAHGTVAHQAPLAMESSRQEYWSGLPFPSAGKGMEPASLRSPALAGGFFTTTTTREAHLVLFSGSIPRAPPHLCT